MTHSPYPWTSFADISIIRDANGAMLCLLFHDTGDRQAANKRLMTGAPEMLAALKLCVAAFQRNEYIGQDDIEALVKRIEGTP